MAQAQSNPELQQRIASSDPIKGSSAKAVRSAYTQL
jgi:hypothetical protein